MKPARSPASVRHLHAHRTSRIARCAVTLRQDEAVVYCLVHPNLLSGLRSAAAWRGIAAGQKARTMRPKK